MGGHSVLDARRLRRYVRRMPSTTQAAPLSFDQFWRWLQDHRNCLVRCGAGDAAFFDNDWLHWDFFEEDDGRAVCQAIFGKALVGELVIERSEVLFVQASSDPEDPDHHHWLFECVGGARGENFPLYHFVLTHGMEGAQGHQVLKH